MYAVKAYGGLEIWLHSFLISALEGGEGSVSRSGCFIPPWENNPRYPLNKEWLVRRVGLEALESDQDTSGVQPVAYSLFQLSYSDSTKLYILPDLSLSRTVCDGTRSASAGHHWFLSSNPVLRGPGRLTSNSRLVFYLYGSWYSFISLTALFL
jgi:hypothetical protein